MDGESFLEDPACLQESIGIVSDDSELDYEIMHQMDIKHDNNSDTDTVIIEYDSSDSCTSDDLDEDREYIMFPLSLEQPDPLCLRLNDLIKSGRIPKDRIMYKYLNDVTNVMIDPNWEYDVEVIEFFNTIKYLGGERTVNFVRGPMWYGTGKGGKKNPEELNTNLGGPSRTTRQKETSGHTTRSGIVKQWLCTGLELANAASLNSNDVLPLVDTPSVKSFAIALENDGTALKPGIQYDEQLQINVGLKDRADFAFVEANPNPTSDFLRSNVVTEANVSYISTLDNKVSMPVGVRFVPKSGKTGENMKKQFLEDITILQTCQRCLKNTESPEHVIANKEEVNHCQSKCEMCIEGRAVCQQCQLSQQPSHLPPLRACQKCLQAGVQCVRACVLVITTDCESGNKTAFETIIDDQNNDLLPPEYAFACIPDAVHVGKSLKASFANWMILLNGERACLSILHCLRDEDTSLRKILPRDAVLNKDRMDVDCILHLTKGKVLDELQKVGRVVHRILPDLYKVTDSNRSGLYPHPIAVALGDHGKLLVLDHKPMSKTTRLLQVRLHSPADVKVVKELGDARHIVYLEGIAYVSEPTGINVIPISGNVTPPVDKLKKDDLKKILEEWQDSVEGTVKQLRQRMKDHITKRSTEHQKAKRNTKKVILSEELQTSSICSMTDSILISASDKNQRFYTIELKSDGVAMHGLVNELCHYPAECVHVISLSVRNGTLFVAFKGVKEDQKKGGLLSIDLNSRTTSVLLRNDTEVCSECTGIASHQDGVLFCDAGTFQVKYLDQECNVEMIAGNGREGNAEGRAENSSFGQLMGICTENTNIFVTDPQTGCVKLVTTITGTVTFLKHLAKLYRAFSVHLKHETVPRLPIAEAMKEVSDLKNFLEGTVSTVQASLNSQKATNGPEGTVSNQTLKSVQMIYSQLGTLQSTIQAINKEIDVDLHSCLTTQVENLHAVGHFKDEFPTVLNFARNLGNSVYESIKRITSWAAYYFTHPTSYYPIPDNSISLKEISKLPHLGKTRHLDSKQAQMMREWAVLHGKCVRQRTVRQETTKFKAGTLPLNMYRPSLSDYPKEKVNLFQNHMPDAPIIAHEEEEREEEEQEQEENGVTSNLQEDEYDTDSEREHAVDDDNDDDDDTLTFMRAVTTRSGRAVRVRFFS